jgi:zinc protease
LLADVAQHPTFDENAFDTERAIALADVVALRDDMYRYPMRLANQAAFEDHPYGTPAGGTEDSLKRVSGADVRRWHAERALTGQAVVALVGDRDPDELASIAARAFKDLRASTVPSLEAPRWPMAITSKVETRDRAQTALAMLFPAPGRGDPRRFSAEMIAGVASGLGGRFFDELREKRSLGYTVHAFSMERRLAGTFGAYIATSPEQEDAARDGLLAEFRRLRDEPVTEEELVRAQTYAIGTHAIRQQNGGAVLADIVDAYLFGSLSELVEYETSVRAVTAQSMQAVAEEFFDQRRRVEGIVRGVGKRV